jgi:hypothetical protein
MAGLFFVSLFVSTQLVAQQPLKYEPVAGEWFTETDDEGREILRAKRISGPEGDIEPRLRFTNVPDGPFAIQLDTRVNICYPGGTVLVRGKELGDGMVLMFHGSQSWRALRNNLAPGHVEKGVPLRFGLSSTLYDTKTITAELYKDYPALLDAEHPHSKKEEWWTIKVQVWNSRFMAKAWLNDTPEPDGWFLDLPVPLDETGPVGLQVGDPSWLRDMTRVPVEPGEFKFVDVDHREKRYGPPLEDFVIDVSVEETASEFVVRSDLTELTFDRTRCSIRVAQMRRAIFPVESLPDLKIVDEQGREFRQRYAIDGDLGRLGDEERWLVFSGRCTPRTREGEAWPYPFEIRYRLHRQSGLVHVAVRPLVVSNEPVAVRQLAMVHGLADSPGQELNSCQIVADRPDQRFFGLGNRAVTHAGREDDIVASGQLLIGTWGNGGHAFQVTPRSYSLCAFDDDIGADTKGYHHLVVGTRSGHRFLDLVFINSKSARPLSSDAVYENTFSFLPWRRYRPRVELFAGSKVCGDATLHNVDFEQERLRSVALTGATLHCHGYPPMGLLATDIEQARVGRQIKESHYYGLKDKVSWVLGNNWIGAWPHFPNQQPFEEGWLTEEEGFRARRLRPLKKGQTRKEGPRIPSEICVNDEVTRRLAVDHITMPVVDKFKSSAIYWDWTWPIYPCSNADHGDAPVSMTPLGHVALVDRFRKESAKRPWKPMIMGCTYDAHCTPVSLLDMFNPGEAGKGWYVPNHAEHDLIYSSLLYGTQCIYHTYGGIALDTPRVYEQALAHCSTLMLSNHFADAPDHDPPGTPGGGNEREREMWTRYMTPLTIFDVNRSEYRHPYDGDYGEFASTSAGVTAVLYFREGRVLLVVVKDHDGVQDGQVTLRTRRLGVDTSRVLAFDVIDKKAQVLSTVEGVLKMPPIRLAGGPRIYVLESLPTEPKVVWHSPATWSARVSGEGSRRSIRMTGVPSGSLRAYLWCADTGVPRVVSGGQLVELGRQVVAIDAVADAAAEAMLEVVWERP